MTSLTTDESFALLLDELGVSGGVKWRDIARPEQVRPEGQDAFILIGGRGSGKTRAAAEDCLEILRQGKKIAHVLCPTRLDAKKTCMKGDAGSSILECARPGEIESFNQSDLEIRFKNGSVLRGFTAEEPGRLNGPQCHHLWIDEFGLCSVSAIDMAIFGNRLGERATFCGSSTPKLRPGTKHTLNLFPGIRPHRMRLQDNEANLAPNFVKLIVGKYAGTRLGRAEIDGELVEDVEGALWSRSWFIEKLEDGQQNLDYRVHHLPHAITGHYEDIPKEIKRIVIGIDPTVADPELQRDPHKDMDACGVAVVGADAEGRAYVLGDYTAVMHPSEWAKLAVRLHSVTRASNIVAEGNQGGQLVLMAIKAVSPMVPVTVVHASIGKRARAEPVSMLYEQGRVIHCGDFPDLIDQMCTWNPLDVSAANKSPNNIDALVWAFHGLGLCQATGIRTHDRMKKR